MLRIKHIIEEGKELEIIRDLFREYEKELAEDICFQSFDEELKHPLKKIWSAIRRPGTGLLGRRDRRLYCINKNERTRSL